MVTPPYPKSAYPKSTYPDKVHYLQFSTVQDDAHRSPLVCLHGIGGDARSFQPQLQGLAGFCPVIAWSMPGYGETPAPQAPLKMSFELLSDALFGLLEQLELDSVHLLGHSIGGMIAQEFVARHPARVRSLILSATSPAFGRSDGEFQKQFLAARLKPLDDGCSMRQLADGIVDSLLGGSPQARGVALARQCMSEVTEAGYRSAIETLVTFDRRADLARIRIPALLIAGEHDRNAPAPMMERMATHIPHSSYECIRGAGHLANLEQPDQFNRLALDFLQSVEPASSDC